MRLCPFNNRVPNCTKDRASDPLGVCSLWDGEQPVITCPVRFRQDWLIAEDAAAFFFDADTSWTSLSEVRLNDGLGKSAGNIDIVLVAYDRHGQIIDFGSLEVQAVYISGNVRRPFAHFMADPAGRAQFDWSGERNYPRPDFLSSSRKRLAPQLIYKGGILRSWGKKMAVAVDRPFFETLPVFAEVDAADATLVWLVYDLRFDESSQTVGLIRQKAVYVDFDATLATLTTSQAGPIAEFIGRLQEKLDQVLEERNPPDAPTLSDMLHQ